MSVIKAARYEYDPPDHELQPVEVSLAYSDYKQIQSRWVTYFENREAETDADAIAPADIEGWDNDLGGLTAMIDHAAESNQLTPEQVVEVTALQDEMLQRIKSDLKTMPQNHRNDPPEDDDDEDI